MAGMVATRLGIRISLVITEIIHAWQGIRQDRQRMLADPDLGERQFEIALPLRP